MFQSLKVILPVLLAATAYFGFSIFYQTYMLSPEEKMSLAMYTFIIGSGLFVVHLLFILKLLESKKFYIFVPVISAICIIYYFIIDYLVRLKDGNYHEYLVTKPIMFALFTSFISAGVLKKPIPHKI
jgi:hypothetical protein